MRAGPIRPTGSPSTSRSAWACWWSWTVHSRGARGLRPPHLRHAVHRDRRHRGPHPRRLPPARLLRPSAHRRPTSRQQHRTGAPADRHRVPPRLPDRRPRHAGRSPRPRRRVAKRRRRRAPRRPAPGHRPEVARLFLGLMRNEPGVELVEEDVNGTPGVSVRIAMIAVVARTFTTAWSPTCGWSSTPTSSTPGPATKPPEERSRAPGSSPSCGSTATRNSAPRPSGRG